MTGAKNFTSYNELKDDFFTGFRLSYKGVVVIYCEYSSQRGPGLARAIRRHDEAINADFFPRLCYPQIFVLEGGYREFYNEFMNRCSPPGYISMMEPQYRFTLKAYRRCKIVKKHYTKEVRSRRRLDTSCLSAMLKLINDMAI